MAEQDILKARSEELSCENASLKQKRAEDAQERDTLKRKHEEDQRERDALKRKHEEGAKTAYQIMQDCLEIGKKRRTQKSQLPAPVQAADDGKGEVEVMLPNVGGHEETSELVTKALVELEPGFNFRFMEFMRMIYGSDVTSRHPAYQPVYTLLNQLVTEQTQLPNGNRIGKVRNGPYQVDAA